MERIVIAGATGFVGTALAARLARRTEEKLEIVGLTRGRTDAKGAWDSLVSCDLFSLKDVEQALEGATYVAYLVHSMSPSARLVQASFEDLDLICADNVGRAAKKAGVKQIVYLGGLLPPSAGRGDAESTGELSTHLESRREVERALGAHGVPVTVLRAGLVIGPGGSSFEMMERLVKRLPMMLLPRWTEHRCQPIDLGTAVALIDRVVGKPQYASHTYDIGGPDALPYRELMQIVADELQLQRRMVPVPFVSPTLSRFWVSLVTGAPKALVKPLIESLRHEMVCRDRRLQDAEQLPGLTFRAAVRACIAADAGHPEPDAPLAYKPAPRSAPVGVRSIQRIPLPKQHDAEWAAREYMRWLPWGAWPLLHVIVDAARMATFSLVFTRKPLLVLRFAPDRSGADRQLFYVVGGWLAKTTQRGRLEFRQTPDGEHLLTAIHDFAPRLPWRLYRVSQALVHKWVMHRFGKHLARARALLSQAA